MKKLILILLIHTLGLSSTISFAQDNTPTQPNSVEDLNTVFFGTSNQTQIQATPQATPQGIYVEHKYCKTPLKDLTELEKQLNIEQPQKLIQFFEEILCAPKDQEGNVQLGHLAEHIQDPISTSIAMYMGRQDLGQWSLEDAQMLASSAAQQATFGSLGLHIGGTRATFSFWQVISPTHVRVWYGPFKDSPSDAMTYDFQLKNQQWTLTQLWMSSRI